MNPFDLRGPQFLLFYAIFSVVVLILLRVYRRSFESFTATAGKLTDPYLIAFLRGGKNEVLRVATLSLIDRGLLQAHGSRLQTRDSAAVQIPRRTLERDILRKYKNRGEASAVFSDAALEANCKEFESQLKLMQLLPDEAIRSRRAKLFLIGAAVLASTSVIKILIAISRGRYNILFLILLSIVSLVAALEVTHPRLTARGKAVLKDLRELFGSLKDRAGSGYIRAGGSTNELALIAAVFGVGALPKFLAPHVKQLYPRVTQGSSSSCGSSCGSACGSSCGGGGCGGGCGGCGG